MEINYKDLFVHILTQDEIDEFSEIVIFLLKSAYKMEKDVQEVTLTLPVKFAKTIEDYFTAIKQNRYDPIEFGNGLKSLIDTLEKLDKVELTMAMEPNYKLIQDISSWFYQNVDKKVILKINVDKNIIAGMHINYNGTFLDYSYQKIFNDKLSEIEK